MDRPIKLNKLVYIINFLAKVCLNDMSIKEKHGLYKYEDQEKLADAIPKLKKLIEDNKTSLSDSTKAFANSDDTYTRFLRARSYDIQEAYKQLSFSIDWRESFEPVTTLRCTFCEENPGFHSMRQVGHDIYGRPIIYACFAQACTTHNNVEDSVMHTVCMIENAKLSMDQLNGIAQQWVFVIDCHGMTMGSCNPKLGYGVAEICGLHYPERLGKILVVNHSPLFQHVWTTIRVFLDPKTAKKLKFLKNHEKMKSYLDKMCSKEVSDWLLEEIRLNASCEGGQMAFWNPPKCTETDHDPRGTISYISKFISPLRSLKNEKNIPSGLHLPHPNILAVLFGKEYLEEDLKSRQSLSVKQRQDEENNIIETESTCSNEIKDKDFRSIFGKIKL